MNSSINPQVNEILRKERLAPSITLFEVHSPLIANTVRAGQYVVATLSTHYRRVFIKSEGKLIKSVPFPFTGTVNDPLV